MTVYTATSNSCHFWWLYQFRVSIKVSFRANIITVKARRSDKVRVSIRLSGRLSVRLTTFTISVL